MSSFIFAAILQVFIIVMLLTIYYFFKRKYILFIAMGLFTLFISSLLPYFLFPNNIYIEIISNFLFIIGSLIITHAFLLVINLKLSKKIIISMLVLTALTMVLFRKNIELKTFIVSIQGIGLMCVTLYNYIKSFSKNDFKGFRLLISANVIVLILHLSNALYLALSWIGLFEYSDDFLMTFYAGMTVFQFLTVAGVFISAQEMLEKQKEENRLILLQKEDYYNQMKATNSLLDKSKAFLYKLTKIDSEKIIVSKEFAQYMGMDSDELEYKNDKEYFLNRALFWDKYIDNDYRNLMITRSKIKTGEIDLDKLYHIKAYRYIDGIRYKRWLEISYIERDNGEFEVVVLDITRLKNTIRTDYLTGVRNNIAFSEDFENKSFVGHVIAFADIDRFKQVNDNFGHIAGDEVLINTARMLKFDGKFTVYRISGDEFIFVSKEKATLKDVYQNINDCNFKMTVRENIPIMVNLSVGVIEYASHHDYTKDELLNLLDTAMYDAKKQKTQYSEITENYRDYRNLFDSSALAQTIIDVKSFKTVDVSDAYVKMFKAKSKMDFIGGFPKELYPKFQPSGEKSEDFISRQFKNVLEKKYVSTMVSQIDFEGNELIVEMHAKVTKNNGIDILVVTKKDITKQYKAKKKIKQLSDRLNNVIESAKILVWTIDYTKSPYTLWVSNNVKNFFDVEQDENGYVSYYVWDDILLEGIGKERFEKYKRMVFKDNVSILDLVKFKNAYGEENYLSFKSNETKYDENGKMIALTGVVINSNNEMEKIQQLEESHTKINQMDNRIKSLLQTSNVMICTFDYSNSKPQMWASDNVKSYLNVRQDESGYVPYEDWVNCAVKALGDSNFSETDENYIEAYLCDFEFVEFKNAYDKTNYLSMRSVNTGLDDSGNLIKVSCIFMNTSSEAKQKKQLEINKLNFENIFEKATMGLVIVDMKTGRMVECNEAYIKMFNGKDKDQIIGLVMGTYLNSEINNEKSVQDVVLEHIEKIKEHGRHKCEYKHLLNGKEEMFLEIDAAITEYNHKPAIVASVIDITESKKMTQLLEERRKSLEENKHRYELAEKGAKIASWHWDMEKDICYATKEFVNIFGGNSTIENAKQHFFGRLLQADVDKSNKDLNDFFNGKIDYLSIKARFYCKNSDTYQWVHIVSQIIERDEKGKPKISTGIIMNIHEQKIREEKLLEESIVDSLTGLHNSRYLSQYLEKLKQEKDVKIVVGYLTILGLRHINNAYGYANGEKLIVKVAKMLKKIVSDNTSVFRVSNDEFVIVTKNEYSYNNIINNEPLYEIESALKGRMKINDSDVDYRLCCGVVAYPYHTNDFDNIIYLSEIIMMYGKDTKQNIQYYDSKVIEDIFHERKVIKDFGEADLEKEFLLYYQPVVDVNESNYSSVEALVRWNHPEKGLLSPGYFIDILEKTKLMNKLALILFEKVLNQIIKWKEETGKDVVVSFNLSPTNISSNSLIDNMLKLVEELKINKKQIIVELVEGAFDTDDKKVFSNIEKIRKSGIGIAIDDFGVSYSSLSRVSNIEYDVLKIDKSFACNVEKEKNRRLVDIIYSIAKLSGVKCVAEGIETQDQLKIYKEIGVNYIQGYYFYKPLPPEEIKKLLLK